MTTNKAIAYIFVFFISLALTAAADYEVTRDFLSDEVETGATLDIRVNVEVGQADAYAIDDTLPEGWSFVNSGQGDTREDGHIKWLVVGELGHDYSCEGISYCESVIEDTTYLYTVRAPEEAGEYVFSGTYLFDTQAGESENSILGDSRINVVDPAPTTCDYITTESECVVNSDCRWCPLDNSCKSDSRVECTSSGCRSDGTSFCTSSCTITECNTGMVCEGGQCVDDTADDTNGDTSDDTTDGSTDNTGDGSGSSSTPACNEDWDCTQWTPDVCPEDRVQTRECTDTNNCGTENNKPRTSRTCRRPRGTTVSDESSEGEDSSGIRDYSRGESTSQKDNDTAYSRGSRSFDTDAQATRDDEPATEGSEKTKDTKERDVNEENASLANLFFYILLILLIFMAVGFFYYYRHNKVEFNKARNKDKEEKQQGIRPL